MIIQGKLTDNLKKIIYAGLKEHSIMEMGVSEIGEPISFYIETPEGRIAAAIVFHSFWGALHIKYVWTHKDHRGKGYASKLMQEVFNFAKDRKYPFAFIETMNFQAPSFYKKFGFKTEFKREGYSKGTSFYYMRKDFDDERLKNYNDN